MYMNTTKPSFTSFLGDGDSYNNDLPSSQEEKIHLLADEQITSWCGRALLLESFSLDHRVFLGSLTCTNFRLIFVPVLKTPEESNELQMASRINILVEYYSVALSNISNLHYKCFDGDKWRLMEGAIKMVSEQVAFLRVTCKDMRVFIFDFKVTESGKNREFVNSVYHFAFPDKLWRLFTPKPIRKNFLGEDRYRWLRLYQVAADWQELLARCCFDKSIWRVCAMVQLFPYRTHSYPDFVVVPREVTDAQLLALAENVFQQRFPIWCWSNRATDCSLLRSASLDTISDHTDAQLQAFLRIISNAHPFKLPVEVFAVDIDLAAIRNAFDTLCYTCSLAPLQNFWSLDVKYYTMLESTGWLKLVRRCLELTFDVLNCCCPTIIEQRRSVLLEDKFGRDMCAVISCLVQLCADFNFRTCHGFLELVHREWAIMGHPFALRLHGVSSLAAGRQVDEMAPLWLLFLDCCSQLISQHPSNFQFNDYFLVALWDLSLTAIRWPFGVNGPHEWDSITEQDVWAWDISDFFGPEFLSITINALYTSLSSNRKREILWPSSSMSCINLWTVCYLRWMTPAHYGKGGQIQKVLWEKQLCWKLRNLKAAIEALDNRNPLLRKLKTFGDEGCDNYSINQSMPSTDPELTSGYPYSSTLSTCDAAILPVLPNELSRLSAPSLNVTVGGRQIPSPSPSERYEMRILHSTSSAYAVKEN